MASLGEFTDIQSVSLEIYGDQRAWIEHMIANHGESADSAAAVIRCLLDYAITDGDERLIFKKIRCRRCGRKFGTKPIKLDLCKYQIMWLQGVRTRCKVPTIDKCLRIMLDFVQEGRTTRRMNDQQRAQVILALEQSIFDSSRKSEKVALEVKELLSGAPEQIEELGEPAAPATEKGVARSEASDKVTTQTQP